MRLLITSRNLVTDVGSHIVLCILAEAYRNKQGKEVVSLRADSSTCCSQHPHYHPNSGSMSKVRNVVGPYWNTRCLLEPFGAGGLWVLPGSDQHGYGYNFDSDACNTSMETSDCTKIEDWTLDRPGIESLVSFHIFSGPPNWHRIVPWLHRSFGQDSHRKLLIEPISPVSFQISTEIILPDMELQSIPSISSFGARKIFNLPSTSQCRAKPRLTELKIVRLWSPPRSPWSDHSSSTKNNHPLPMKCGATT